MLYFFYIIEHGAFLISISLLIGRYTKIEHQQTDQCNSKLAILECSGYRFIFTYPHTFDSDLRGHVGDYHWQMLGPFRYVRPNYK